MTQTNQLLNQIKEILGKNPKGMSITEIAQEIGLNRNSVAKYVNMLLVSGQVEMRAHAAAKVFYLSQRVPLSNLLGISNEGVLVVDQALRAVQVNDNFCYQVGIEREAIEDRYILDIPDFPLDTSRMLVHLKAALNGRKTRDEESFMKGKACRHLRVQYTPTTFEDGEPAVAVVLTDITDQKNFTRMMEETEERYRILTESAQDIIFLASPEGKILYMNAYGAGLLKSDPDSLRGRSIKEIFPCDENEDCMEEILQAIRISESASHEARHILAGAEYWFEHRLIPIDGDADTTPYIMGISRDITLRKRAEIELERNREHLERLVAERTAELQESEERLRMALEGTNDGLWDRRVATGEVYYSTRYYTMLGYEPGEFPPEYDVWKSLVHPDDLAAALQEMDKHSIGEKPYYRKIFRMRSKSGEYRWILSRGRVVERSLEGKPLRVVGTHTDITEQKQAEKALQESEEKFRSILSNSLDALYQRDLGTGRFNYVSPAVTSLTGFSVHEILQWDVETIINRVHPDDRPTVLADKLGTESPVLQGAVDYRLLHKDGTYRWIAEKFHLISDSTGKPIAREGSLRDITERKRAEEALQKSEVRLAAVLENMPVGIWVVDSMGRVTAKNKAADLIWRGDAPLSSCPEDYVEYIAWDVETGKQIEADDYPLTKALRTGLPTTPVELRIRRFDGTEGFILMSTTLLRGPDGLLTGAVGINVDITEHKRAEERYRMLHESMRDAFAQANMDGRIIDCNDLYREMLGYSSEELHQLTYKDLTPEHWHDFEDRIIHDQIIARGYSEVYEKEYRRKDGTIIPVELRTILTRDEGGKPSSMWAIVRDITERKRAEEALVRSEEEKQLILDSSSEQFVYLDTDLRVLWCNQTMADLTGPSKDDLIGKHCYRLRYQRNEPCEGCPVIKALETGEAQEAEFEAPDGKIWFIRGQPLLDEAGNVVNLIEFCHDITKHKQMEAALQAANAYNRSLIEASPDPLVTISPDGRITDVNAATEAVTGYARDMLIGTDFSGYFTDPDLARAGYQQVFGDGMVRDYPLEIQHRDGTVTPVLYNATIYCDEQGTTTGVFAAARDISERKRAEDALRESEEKFRHLFTSMSEGFALHEVLCDDNGEIYDYRFLDVNPAFERLTSLKRKEIIGKTIREVLPPIEELWIERYGRVARTGEPAQFENYAGALNRWYQVHAFSPATGQFATVFLDTTEQKRADEERNILTRIIDAAPCSITVHDLERGFLYANQRTYDLHGYSREEFFSISLYDLDVPEFADQIAPRVQQLHKTGEAVFEVAHRRKDGTAFPLRVHAQTVTWDNKPAILSLAEDITEGKRAEAALAESEERLRRAVKSAREFIFRIEFTPEPALTYVDPEVTSITGIDAEEFAADLSIGLRLIHPEDRPKFEKLIRQEVDWSEPLTLRWILRDGRILWAEEYYTPYYDEDGNLRAVEAVIRDVTAQKRVEEALRQRTEELARLNQQLEESREQYRCLVEHAPDVIALHDGDRYLYINPSGVRLFRAESPDDIVGKSVMTFLHPDFRDMVKIRNEQLKAMAADVPQVEEKLVALDGTIVDVDVAAHLFESQGKRLIQVIARDITDRKKAEEALRESEQRFRYIAEHSPDILYTLDREGRFTYVSPSAERIAGHIPADLIGQNIMDYIVESEIPKAYRARKKVLGGEELHQLRLTIIGKNGEAVPLECNASPIYKGAFIIGSQGIAREITPRE